MPWCIILVEKLVPCTSYHIFQSGTQRSFPWSLPATGTYPEPDEASATSSNATFLKMLIHLHSHLCAYSTPLYSGGTWYTSAYRPNIWSGFCVSPGKCQDCFLPHPLQLLASYHLTIYNLSYSGYHAINCEYAKVCQVVSGLPFFSLSLSPFFM
jgi:hypothetical protein